MPKYTNYTRRDFVKGLTGTTGAAFLLEKQGAVKAHAANNTSMILETTQCPVHDNKRRHIGLDSLLGLMAENGLKLYRTNKSHRWGGPDGIIEEHDIILLKINCQWKFRGATNTDVLRGMIQRILEHPDGFSGEIVIFENGQKQGSFDGDPLAWGRYKKDPECAGVHVNAEDDTLTVDRLVREVFVNAPVSSYLLDPVCETFIGDYDHTSDGFRKLSDAQTSYPCFTTKGDHRIELREGIWDGENYKNNLKLINMPVFKTHPGTGITGVLKHCYGILSMKDDPAWSKLRHYKESGSQCGKFYSLVRMPDLNIVDAIWVTHQQHHRGYPASTTHRADTLLAGLDPVALDYYCSKYILLPLGGDRVEEHDPESFEGLVAHLTGAQEYINSHGGICGVPARQGDDNITVISRQV